MTHTIEEIMKTTMENLNQMIDVNTVIGKPICSSDGVTIIPVSKVAFGFVSGGGEYEFKNSKNPKNEAEQTDKPFAGGAGAGVSVSPAGFLVVGNGGVRMVNAQYPTCIDRMVEAVPTLIVELKKAFTGNEQGSSQMPPEETPASDESYVL